MELPPVSRLQDGREGFILREKAELTDGARSDFQRAVALMQEEKFAEAVELFDQVIAAAPGATTPYINLALAHMRLDHREQAEEALKTALTLFPGHPVASNVYGLLLRKSGRFAEAREIYEKGLKEFPEYLPARKNLGILCDLYLNDPASALGQYELYNADAPDDEEVKVWIADLRVRLGLL